MENHCSIGELNRLEEKLDDFNHNVEEYLFDKISEYQYEEILKTNPEWAVRLLQLLDDEDELRKKIHQMKSLLEMKKEIEQLAADENVRAMAVRAQEDRLKATNSIMDGK